MLLAFFFFAKVELLMVKWLMIIVIALSLFISVMLGLGYILHNNEHETRALVQELKEQQPNNDEARSPTANEKEARAIVRFVDEKAKVEQLNQLVLENLTCVSDNQCKVIALDNEHCQVAINLIGANLVNKQQTKNQSIASCQTLTSPVEAICQDNLCQIKISPL